MFLVQATFLGEYPMNHDAIKQLVYTYFEGWKSGDREKILGTLDPGGVLIEADGEAFRGKEAISNMLETRVIPGNKVERWDITSLYVTDEVCFLEWVFACTYAGEHGGFEGASIVRVNHEKIVSLREYATVPSLP
jgi:hypothetical protein